MLELIASQGGYLARPATTDADWRFEFGSLDAMLGCVAAGLGYTVLPRGTVDAHQHRFGFHTLELPTSIANIDTYFVAPEPETWTPALASFAETLRNAVVVDEPQLTAS